MTGPLRTTEVGFEVWKKDRARGREIFMTRVDEDRLCDALREEFGDFQVVNEDRAWKTPKVEWRENISSFQPFARIGARPIRTSTGPPFERTGAKLVGVGTVSIHFPWPKWELRGEPRYIKKSGTKEEIEASLTGYRVYTTSPLSIRFNRSMFLTTQLMPEYTWQREALLNGFIQTAWCSEGPYVEAQEAFVRKLFRLLGKLTTNRLRYLAFDEAGEIVEEEVKKGFTYWAGQDAVRWCREDERRVLTDDTACTRETGRIAWGYRPLD